jgi:hypothetical protein
MCNLKRRVSYSCFELQLVVWCKVLACSHGSCLLATLVVECVIVESVHSCYADVTTVMTAL